MKKTDKLRSKAEEKLKETKNIVQVPESDAELIHELQVHQIELEMQNEELRESQREYQKLNQKYFDLYNFAPVGYFTLDKNGNILDANLTGESLLDVEKPNLIGRTFIQFITPQFRNIFYKKMKSIIETRVKHEFELKLIKKDKSTFWALIALNFTEDENYYRITVTNIIEYKKLEAKLKEARDKLEGKVKEGIIELQMEKDNLNSILNTTKSGVYIINNDYEVEYINPIMERNFGFYKGQKCYEYFYNEHDICSNCKIQKAFEGNVVEWEQHSTKSNKTYDALATSIIKSNGQISVVVFLYDVTRRDKAEAQLKEIIQELNRSNQELQSFTYITSHDLQEPLRSIVSFAQLLERRYKGQLDKDADEFLKFMVAGATHMKEQIQGLLDYSHIEKQGKKFKEFNSEEALNNALNYLNSAIEECHAEVTHDPLPVIVADKDQIIMVFQNLVSNALKFHQKGVPPKIHISAEKTDTEHIFCVSDNGIGIEEQYTDSIFEVFKRLHTIDQYKGAGIGLAIIKKIIDRHSGRVWVESDYKKGSTFYFSIPIEPIKTVGVAFP